MDVTDLPIDRPRSELAPIIARGRPWGGALLAGLAAVGWLWAALRFSSGLAELAARQTAVAFAAFVAGVFVAGAVPGFLLMRERRRVTPRRRRASSVPPPPREDVDTDPTLPAPPPVPPRPRSVIIDPENADTVPPAGPRASGSPRLPAPDDKEYF